MDYDFELHKCHCKVHELCLSPSKFERTFRSDAWTIIISEFREIINKKAAKEIQESQQDLYENLLDLDTVQKLMTRVMNILTNEDTLKLLSLKECHFLSFSPSKCA